jgi:uncharacterized damage-inducible protein DinB
MEIMDDKATLHEYLRRSRGDLLSKLDGLDEYDAHRPLTETGTSLLGLLKHVASVQLGYFGEVFGRPSEVELPWDAEGADPEADMWATEAETRAEIVALYERSAAHADATIEALPLDAPGEVPWWPPERREVTLARVLVHMIAEVARHAGHGDIVRESIDGAAGRRPGDASVPTRTPEEWAAYRDRIETAALKAAGCASG